MLKGKHPVIAESCKVTERSSFGLRALHSLGGGVERGRVGHEGLGTASDDVLAGDQRGHRRARRPGRFRRGNWGSGFRQRLNSYAEVGELSVLREAKWPNMRKWFGSKLFSPQKTRWMAGLGHLAGDSCPSIFEVVPQFIANLQLSE